LALDAFEQRRIMLAGTALAREQLDLIRLRSNLDSAPTPVDPKAEVNHLTLGREQALQIFERFGIGMSYHNHGFNLNLVPAATIEAGYAFLKNSNPVTFPEPHLRLLVTFTDKRGKFLLPSFSWCDLADEAQPVSSKDFIGFVLTGSLPKNENSGAQRESGLMLPSKLEFHFSPVTFLSEVERLEQDHRGHLSNLAKRSILSAYEPCRNGPNRSGSLERRLVDSKFSKVEDEAMHGLMGDKALFSRLITSAVHRKEFGLTRESKRGSAHASRSDDIHNVLDSVGIDRKDFPSTRSIDFILGDSHFISSNSPQLQAQHWLGESVELHHFAASFRGGFALVSFGYNSKTYGLSWKVPLVALNRRSFP